MPNLSLAIRNFGIAVGEGGPSLRQFVLVAVRADPRVQRIRELARVQHGARVRPRPPHRYRAVRRTPLRSWLGQILPLPVFPYRFFIPKQLGLDLIKPFSNFALNSQTLRINNKTEPPPT